jgi:DNA repair protein RadA/Sms
VASGIDGKKLSLLLAILEKRLEMPMSSHDVFASVAGGLRIAEPALDLAILTAIASSMQNRPVRAKTMIVGEVGLSGEVRGITQIDRRVSEAAKLGFTTVVVPETNRSQVQESSVEVISVTDIQTALDVSLG